MGENTKIEWADDSVNIWWGCQRHGTGCQNCYAESLAARFHPDWKLWGNSTNSVRLYMPKWQSAIRRLNAKAQKEGTPRVVFINSMSDFFEDFEGPLRVAGKNEETGERELHHMFCGPKRVCDGSIGSGVVPSGQMLGTGGLWSSERSNWTPLPGYRHATVTDLREEAFRVFDECQWLRFMLLTKRPENIRRMWCSHVNTDGRPPSQLTRENVWLGTSIACQADADRLIPELLKCRDLCAKVFVSAEPLLEPIDFCEWTGYNPHHENNTQRRVSVRGCADGTSSDSRRRIDLESQVSPQESLERRNHHNASDGAVEGGCGVRGGLSHGQSDDGLQAGDVFSASPSVAACPRPDTSRGAGESQGWQQGEQSSGESGDMHGIGKHASCAQNGARDAKRNTQQPQSTISDGRRGDAAVVQGGESHAGGLSEDLRDFPSSGVEDSTRTKDAARGWTDGRLLDTSETRDASEKLQRPISLVIVGGESGPNARPCNVAWIRAIVQQCKAAGVPVFVKQDSGPKPGMQGRIDDETWRFKEFPNDR